MMKHVPMSQVKQQTCKTQVWNEIHTWQSLKNKSRVFVLINHLNESFQIENFTNLILDSITAHSFGILYNFVPDDLINSSWIHLKKYIQMCVLILLFTRFIDCNCAHPQWGTADTENKVPSVGNQERTNVLPLKPGVGQNYIPMHTASNFFSELNATFPLHLPSFFSKSSPYFLTA